jgi:DNA topoisomerase-3
MLILCEKPSVAKEFAETLGCARKNGYYEGGGTVITYCVGHLFEPCGPEAYNPEMKKWRVEDLPIIPGEWKYEKTEGTGEQADTVLKLLKRHEREEILIATDAGREGELIARIVLREAGIREEGRIRRFWVSEALTAEVIREGMAEAKPLKEYEKISRQGYARQHADWLVGINLTRYMSIGNAGGVFSVGRVQTAVLSAVAARNAERAGFVPTRYIALKAEIEGKDGKRVSGVLINPRTGKAAFTEEERGYVEGAERYCRGRPDAEGEAEIERKTEKPEKLLNITGLEKEAYKRYGYSPEKTLDLAQSLYERHKCLSYPRTPSRVMGERNVELFREKYETLKQAYPELSEYTDPSLIREDNRHLFNSAALEDHHALIPLRELPGEATEEEGNVYGIVLRSFFTACMPDYVYDEKKMKFTCGGYVFQAVIREVLEEGWKRTVRGAAAAAAEEIPEVRGFDEKGCRIAETERENKKTTAPKDYSIDTLLAFMENPKGEGGEKLSGLGTPATRGEIIKTLKERGYVEEDGKKLIATEKGRYLLGELGKDGELKKLTEVGTTTKWEKELEEDPERFEEETGRYIRSCITGGKERGRYERAALGECPVCGKKIVEGKKNYYCEGYKGEEGKKGCGFVIWKETAGAAVTAEDARILLEGKTTGIKKCVTKAGKKFRAAFKLERGGILSLIFTESKRGKAAKKR